MLFHFWFKNYSHNVKQNDLGNSPTLKPCYAWYNIMILIAWFSAITWFLILNHVSQGIAVSIWHVFWPDILKTFLKRETLRFYSYLVTPEWWTAFFFFREDGRSLRIVVHINVWETTFSLTSHYLQCSQAPKLLRSRAKIYKNQDM